jgi:DNA-binding MarR family transcriptional regulator
MVTKTAPQEVSDPLARRVTYLLRRVSAAMMAGLASSLAELELRPVEASMLVVIAANPGCKQAQIGRLLGIKAANMAPLIGALVTRGMIAKSQMDGRSQAVVLTKLGKVAAREAERRMDLLDAQVAQMLGATGCAKLATSLTTLLETAVGSEPAED